MNCPTAPLLRFPHQPHALGAYLSKGQGPWRLFGATWPPELMPLPPPQKSRLIRDFLPEISSFKAADALTECTTVLRRQVRHSCRNVLLKMSRKTVLACQASRGLCEPTGWSDSSEILDQLKTARMVQRPVKYNHHSQQSTD